jgi:FAD/FMN-containing dehydrogenase
MLALPGHERQVHKALQALNEGLRPWDTGATLPNFLSSGDTEPYRVRAAYRDADYERLAAIKATYDPQNLFRVNHNIPPAS